MRTLGVMVIVATVASADVGAETLIVGTGEFRWSRNQFSGEVATDLGTTWLGWRFAGGLAVGRVSVMASAGFAAPEAVGVQGYKQQFSQWTLGSELRYRIGPPAGFRGYLRAGGRRHWIDGSHTVTRLCSEFSVCSAGFWNEQPSYRGLAYDAGVGVEWLVPPMARTGALFGVSFDVGFQWLTYRRVDRDVSGGVLTFALGATFGGGRIPEAR